MKYRYGIFFLLVSTLVYVATINYLTTSKKNLRNNGYLQNEGSNISYRLYIEKNKIPPIKINNSVPPNTLDPAENIKKKIYLTFDDGPSDIITDKVLDVLKDYNVKATFFIIGNQIKNRETVLNRIYKEGHSIGLHSYSHKYKRLYKTSESFVNEMKQTEVEIDRVIGTNKRINIIRFPSGSRKHLDKELAGELKTLSYKVFDWNISAGDGYDNDISADRVYKNSIKRKGKFTRLILLMHCSNDNKETVKALPKIIKYYRRLGYKFVKIENNTKEYHFRYK